MSVSSTPVTTYDDGFPKAHPSLPPSTRRSGRGVVHRRTLVELTDDHESLATRVVDPTLSTAETASGRHSFELRHYGSTPFHSRLGVCCVAARSALSSRGVKGRAAPTGRLPRPIGPKAVRRSRTTRWPSASQYRLTSWLRPSAKVRRR